MSVILSYICTESPKCFKVEMTSPHSDPYKEIFCELNLGFQQSPQVIWRDSQNQDHNSDICPLGVLELVSRN